MSNYWAYSAYASSFVSPFLASSFEIKLTVTVFLVLTVTLIEYLLNGPLYFNYGFKVIYSFLRIFAIFFIR